MGDIEVGREIARQIGNIALSMMGAKQLTAGDNSLSFRLGRGATGSATHVTVTLTPADLYTVELLRCTVNHGRREVARAEMVYAESLNATIAGLTGFALSL